ncbi:probable E3 ubiquitin-protein ligase RNF144A-A [Setaria italica]|uniref:probable E3 ubiquitin-protein ligase RNF144A-A n=1 Tax=Setaria italica TaxID=4555 RepID=UPI0003514380|nr:probable E3 ubiquitin-protein ligase RNF144A-A [Setaria italica]
MEEEHDNRWYESIRREAQRMEQMEEEPGLYEVSYFQTQLPRPQQEPREEPLNYNSTEGLGFIASDLDPDEPGPSMVRPARVPPLADDEVPKFKCGICMETLPILDLFHGMQCEHRFCVECMATYIEGRIHDCEVPIPCPDPACRELGEDSLVLHPEECKKSIDFAAFVSWGYRLTESAIPQNRRAYCPNRQCGVMLEATGGKTPVMAFCPVCSHPMCATCGVDWSKDDSGQHDCFEGPSAALVKKLAEERRWKQCPRCKMLVEKIYGCNVMRCRCKFIFCYACGLPTGRQMGMEPQLISWTPSASCHDLYGCCNRFCL